MVHSKVRILKTYQTEVTKKGKTTNSARTEKLVLTLLLLVPHYQVLASWHGLCLDHAECVLCSVNCYLLHVVVFLDWDSYSNYNSSCIHAGLRFMMFMFIRLSARSLLFVLREPRTTLGGAFQMLVLVVVSVTILYRILLLSTRCMV